MKDQLAEKILAKTMNWDHETLKDELYRLQVMSSLKYDSYQQFSSGKQFIESLALWLKRFPQEDRQCAYLFVKENIVFISEREVQQLVSVAFEEKIRNKIIDFSKQDRTLISRAGGYSKQIYQFSLRKTLFLGLSDGAHMDFFRRYNNFLSNEQVFMHYDFSQEKYEKMLKDLREDLREKFIGVDVENEEFDTFVLIDDFSGSGISYIRKETDNGESIWKGKLHSFIKKIVDGKNNHNRIRFHVILYIATHEAVENIRRNLKKLIKEQEWNIEYTVEAIQYVGRADLDWKTEKLLEKDFVSHNNESFETFMDHHYRKGNVSKPYMGFNGCALPLVLYHNTPNNSFPIIWYGWTKKGSGHLDKREEALFPRITRHKEN